jgi:hypothetical protein
MTPLVLLLLVTLSAATPSAQVGEAVSAGFAAEARNDAPALMRAATRLQALGAHPVDGQADLAADWKARALALGAKPSDDPVWRGRLLGPAYRQGTLAPNGRFETRQSFIAGQKADVSVEAGNVALELSVSDEDGKAVCQVTNATRSLGCRWVPPFTGPNTIAITNTQAVTARYVLVTN